MTIFDVFLGCFLPRPKNSYFQISHLRTSLGFSASVIMNIGTKNLLNEELRVYTSKMLKILGRLVDLQSSIGEIFRVQIRDHQGQKPPMSAWNVKSEATNARALAENTEEQPKKNNENRDFGDFSVIIKVLQTNFYIISETGWPYWKKNRIHETPGWLKMSEQSEIRLIFGQKPWRKFLFLIFKYTIRDRIFYMGNHWALICSSL